MIDKISSAAYRQSITTSFRQAFAPWSKMTPQEWATEVYRLPSGAKFSFDYAPYSLQMFLSIFDKSISEVIFQLFSRGLKSTVVLLALGYIIDQQPRRILSLWPTNKHGELFRKDNLNKELFDCTPCLQFLGSAAKKRTGENTLLHLGFPGGVFSIFGANAPGDMRRAKGSFLYGEEIDAIKTEETDEGDQLAIFKKRGDEYPDTIKVFASYPALKLLDSAGQPRNGHSRVNTMLLKSDENEWHSTCVKCGGEPFIMHPDQIVAEKGKAADAHFKCPRCGAFLDDAQRHFMAHLQGHDNWKPRRAFRGLRGFQGNAMLWPHPTDPVKMPGGALQMIAQQREDAENSDNPKRSIRTFFNMVLGETFDPTDESEVPPDWKGLHARREDYTAVPQAASFLTAFGDVQKDRIEVGWRAYGRKEESWGMDHVVLDGYVRDREVWCALVRELGRQFPHESGATLSLGFAFVDGGHYAEDVYRFFQYVRAALAPFHPVTNPFGNVAAEFFKGVPVETIGRVYGHCRASKGVGKHGAPVVAFKMSTVAKNLKGHEIGTWEVKDRIYARLRMAAYGPAYLHFNKQYSENYFQQLVVEKVTSEYDGGQEIRKYENPDQARNEGLDIEVGCYAALNLRVRNFDGLETKIAEEAALLKQKQATTAVQPAQIQQPQRQQSSVARRLSAW